jgi:hypothetical protein
MTRRFAVLAVLAVLASTSLSFTVVTCRAQWVDVSSEGGVHVWTPFVRVHVDPNGGTSVRAPFTAVDVPGRAYPDAHAPIIIEQTPSSLPSTQELAAMDDDAIWQLLRATADRLHERLARFDTGATWQRYLQLPEEALNDQFASPSERRDALTQLLDRFRYVTSERQYAKISDLSAFATMRAVLTEVVSRSNASAAAVNVSDEELPIPRPDGSSSDK